MLFYEKGAFISLLSLLRGKSLTCCTSTCSMQNYGITLKMHKHKTHRDLTTAGEK